MKQEIPPFNVLIAAAGQGVRMGGELPKQYIKINGKPILRHTIDAFLNVPTLKQLRVIIDPQHADLYHDAVKGLNLPGTIHGGKERKDSIFNGIKSFSNITSEEILLIHDAARPLIKQRDIENLLSALVTNKAATLASPVASTLRKENNGNCDTLIDRDGLWALQTPQGFHFGDLIKAHENADPDQNHTDDTSLVSEHGIPVKLVKGNTSNIKITTQEDLEMAEKLLSSNIKTETRTGQGFDVHAFDFNKPGPIRLCGIDSPHDHPLKGHSDADVVLHTATDAILGAIGEGDIGQHFPPSDNTFKDMDSATFLKKAIQLTANKNASINNIDLTIICETPKIGPHVQAMKQRLSEITNLDENRINIKATTTEQLGFTGRKEGIAAQAIATVSFP